MPHERQNFLSAIVSLPQFGQYITPSFALEHRRLAFALIEELRLIGIAPTIAPLHDGCALYFQCVCLMTFNTGRTLAMRPEFRRFPAIPIEIAYAWRLPLEGRTIAQPTAQAVAHAYQRNSSIAILSMAAARCNANSMMHQAAESIIKSLR
jgi:hypothetical protein